MQELTRPFARVITDATKAAYLATLIEKGGSFERYSGDPASILNLTLAPNVTNKLNKLKKTLPEAFYY